MSLLREPPLGMIQDAVAIADDEGAASRRALRGPRLHHR